MYETYHTIFIITTALAVLAFVVSIILFIRLHILKVISDLTGRSAKKEIERIRQRNTADSSENMKHKRNYSNPKQTVVTDRMTPYGKIDHREAPQYCVATEKLDTTQLLTQADQALEPTSHETVVLNVSMTQSQVVVLEDITFLHTTEYIAS